MAGRVMRRAVLALLIPLGYLALLGTVRLATGWIRRRLAAPRAEPATPAADGLARLRGSAALRGVLAEAARLFKWAAYVFLTYAFLVVLFDQFPRTARLARYLLDPLRELSLEAGSGTVKLLPRLPLMVLILILARAANKAVGRTFERVRRGQLRLEPLLSAETAGPAELLARGGLLATTVLLLALLVPGEFGSVLLALLALAGLTLSLGAWEASANLIAGTVILASRPFRRGQRIRIGEIEGTIAGKGLGSLRLRTDSGHVVLVPNRSVSGTPVHVLERERTLGLRLEVRSLAGPAAALGLCRHAAAAAGLAREEGQIELVGVREGVLLFDIVWPVARADRASAARHRFIEALLAGASGMEVEVVSVRAAEP
jgi:hypothetical protein